ncbi:MAG: arsenate reductase family protein [Opitutaceae bacterium]|nr:arsenate reductase family protein [Opitutaceae bacterium]
MLRVYSYKGCDSCRKALKWLRERDVEFENLAIRETPPNKEELEAMLGRYEGNLKKLFNVSGQDYRSLGLKDKLPDMTKQEVISLLSSNGNLIKRPFLIGEKIASVGFKPDVWDSLGF